MALRRLETGLERAVAVAWSLVVLGRLGFALLEVRTGLLELDGSDAAVAVGSTVALAGGTVAVARSGE